MRMAQKTLAVMLGAGIVVSVWQYENCRMSKEIAKLEAKKSQLELENLMLKKESEGYKELQAYIERNKKMIELLRQIDYSIGEGGK